MANVRGNDYFDIFVTMGDYACKTAQALQKIIENFDPDDLEDKLAALHEIEHAADEEKHTLMEKLAKEFIAPIEREDILRMASQLDDVVDGIEDILIIMYMYNVRKILPEANEFMKIIIQSCSATMTTLKEFRNFKKSKSIKDSIIEINRLEETGDKLYSDAMRRLYQSGSDPVEIMAWTEVYSRMERCTDACEHTANLVEEVIMKNT